jgi:hypothetical protein
MKTFIETGLDAFRFEQLKDRYHLRRDDIEFELIDLPSNGSPDTISQPPILTAYFWAGDSAVRGEVECLGIHGEQVVFKLPNSDDNPYKPKINEDGIIGSLNLQDGTVIHADEGFFCSPTAGLEDFLMIETEALIPVNLSAILSGGRTAGEQRIIN